MSKFIGNSFFLVLPTIFLWWKTAWAKIRWLADAVGVFKLPDDIGDIFGRAPMSVPYLIILAIALFGLYLTNREFWHNIAGHAKRVWPVATPTASDDVSRCAENERSIALLSTSLRARDAESKIKEADQIIMHTVNKLLEGSYPNEAAWGADYTVWEPAMKRIDSLASKWAPQPHKPFLDTSLKGGAPPPPIQSNIKSDANKQRYGIVWVAHRRYSDERESILQFFTSKGDQSNIHEKIVEDASAAQLQSHPRGGAVEPDAHRYMTAYEAIHYLADYSEWGYRRSYIGPQEMRKSVLPEAPAEFKRIAEQGGIYAVGRLNGVGQYVAIPEIYWMAATINPFSLHNPGISETVPAAPNPGGIPVYKNVRILKADVKRAWPIATRGW